MNTNDEQVTRDLAGDVRILRGAAADVRACLRPALAWEVIFKVLSAALLLPAFAWASGRLVSLSGQSAVSNEDMVSFVLSPLGVATLAVIAVGALFVTIIEQAGLMAIAGAHHRGHRITGVGAFRHILARSRQLLRVAAIQVGAIALIAAPVVAVGGIAYLSLLAGEDINYHFTERTPQFMKAIAITGVAAVIFGIVGVYVFIHWIYAIPLCVIRGDSAVEALRTSFREVRGEAWQAVRLYAAWALSMLVIGFIVAVAFNVFENAVFGVAGRRLTVLVFFVGLFLAIRFAGGLLYSALSAVTYSFIVTRLFDSAVPRDGRDDEVMAAAEAVNAIPFLAGLTRRRVIIGVSAALLVGAAIASYALVISVDLEDNVLVTAHRGASKTAPENSLSAIREAIRQGCDFAEIDVQETADGTVVVCHDADFMRTVGDPRKIWELTDAELATFDIGSWFSEDFRGERVPTLVEAIRACDGELKLNIELKFNGHQQRLVERVVEILEAEDFVDRCIVTSLKTEALPEVKALNDRIQTGAIVATSIGNMNKLDVDAFSLSTDRASRSRIRALHRQGKDVYVWTVNEPVAMTHFIELGVQSILTDDPPVLIGLLDERRQLSDVERMLLKFHAWMMN